jgi:integrase
VSWRRSQFKQRPPSSKKRPQRIGPATARHDLKTLRSAVNYYCEHIDRSFVAPKVKLPSEPPPRVDYYLTRSDIAARIWAARRNPKARHLVRALLIGIYSGTRPGAIRRLMWVRDAENGWVDLNAGIIHRTGYTKSQTNKLQTRCRIHNKLMPWLRRWREADMKAGVRYVIHFNGKPVKNMQRCWDTTRAKAGFVGEDHGPHILRHSAATWMMQQEEPKRLSPAKIAGFLGMSVATLLEVYGHHHPDFQEDVASFTGKQQRRTA